MPASNARLVARTGLLVAGFTAAASLGCVLYVEDADCGPYAYSYRGACYCDTGYEGDDPYDEGCWPVMTFRITDDCDDGYDVKWKLHSDAREWNWPSGDAYYTTPGLYADGYESIVCENDELICFGGETNGGLVYGVGLDFSATCSDCCYECRSGEIDLGYLTCQ